jgi:signal peptidase II
MNIFAAFAVAGAVFALDQFTKYLVRHTIGYHEIVPVLPFLQLVSVRNEGAAFGMFRSLGNMTFIVFSVIAIIFVAIFLIRTREGRLALSLILGGAAGNLLDRIFLGSVVDFLDVYVGRFHWPAFNVADSALTVGLILLFISSFLTSGKEQRA